MTICEAADFLDIHPSRVYVELNGNRLTGKRGGKRNFWVEVDEESARAWLAGRGPLPEGYVTMEEAGRLTKIELITVRGYLADGKWQGLKTPGGYWRGVLLTSISPGRCLNCDILVPEGQVYCAWCEAKVGCVSRPLPSLCSSVGRLTR